VVTVTVVGGYRALLACFPASIRLANAANVWRSMTCGRLYSYDTLLERLAQDLQDVAAALRLFIQEASAAVRPSDLARQPCRPLPLFGKHGPRPTIHGHERAAACRERRVACSTRRLLPRPPADWSPEERFGTFEPHGDRG
jgi:hypothetical protein